MTELEIVGSGEQVRIGKLVCLLRNYKKHAEEMGGSVPSSPQFFLKPSTSIIKNGDSIVIPDMSEDVHHEVELAIVIGKTGKNISEENAMEHVLGYSVMIDVTARDLQAKAKKAGKPWTVAKGFDTFAPMTNIVPVKDVQDPHNLGIWLKVNGMTRQDSNTSYMIFSVPFVI